MSTIETSNEITGKPTNEHTTETQDQNAVAFDLGRLLKNQEVDAITQLNERPKECISTQGCADLAHHNNFK